MTKLFSLACTFTVALTLVVSQSHAASTAVATDAAKSTVKPVVKATATPHKHAAPTKQGKKKNAKPKTTLKTAKGDIVIYVGDLHCKHCAKRISSKLYAVKGVIKVRTDLKADIAIITPQKKKTVDSLALWAAAKQAGFPALKLVSPTGTYIADLKTKEATLVVKKEEKAVQPKAQAAPKSKATKSKQS